MQGLYVPESKQDSRRIRIAIDIGQYHFVTWDGWREEWITQSPSEWWKKQQWMKEGGHKQDRN